MLKPPATTATFSMALPDEHATQRLAIDIANSLQGGDFVTLSGDLGTGKTTFARALIRYLAGDSAIEVPSPSFTLVQIYDLPPFPLVHADLYRLSGSAELAELGFDDLPQGAVILLEWPDRAADVLPPDRLDIALMLAPKLKREFRHGRVTGYGSLAARVDRMAATRRFIAESGYSGARRMRIKGDASTRAYERLALIDRQVILMNAPRRPDGPPVRDGKTYGEIAHLADNVIPFVAMANGLRQYGFSAPAVYQADLDAGLLIIEDLGDEPIVSGDPPLPLRERYETAVDVLLALHEQRLPTVLPLAPRLDHRIPPYDMDAFLIEAELILDWFLPRFDGAVSGSERDEFRSLWRERLAPAIEAPASWVLRDFHSPNLLWLPRRSELARLGLLDFQDAVIGPPAYDLASLLQDARVDVSEQTELALLGRYVRGRRQTDPGFDSSRFIEIYATLAAQRASKILGIFARLHMRDGKPQYLRHMPRVWGYLQRSLGHPALKPLHAWYIAHVPALNTI
jgi:N-acetylmuramate 1-kinase